MSENLLSGWKSGACFQVTIGAVFSCSPFPPPRPFADSLSIAVKNRKHLSSNFFPSERVTRESSRSLIKFKCEFNLFAVHANCKVVDFSMIKVSSIYFNCLFSQKRRPLILHDFDAKTSSLIAQWPSHFAVTSTYSLTKSAMRTKQLPTKAFCKNTRVSASFFPSAFR